ncbi:uncharacterized protein [Anabrus simplex]|uniref:uncharacterized protein isoform X2 n=1 Tax=Anabrus simplex TaxID=316456 RepID=UPI0035A330C6
MQCSVLWRSARITMLFATTEESAMTAKVLWLFVLVACMCCGSSLSSVDGDHFPQSKTRRCLRHRSYGKMASDCYKRDLHNVPSNLNSDIQILDLSYNRIRELNSDSFKRYTNLEILFLDDNLISYIANDTFQPLHYLEVVLLNLNAISQVPTSLFSLPYLRKVDLSENRLSPSGFNIFSEAPLTNQVTWLSLSSCHLQSVPPLHKFAHLEHLNISGNSLAQLNILELAPLCNIKDLDLGTNYELLSSCSCQLLAQWARDNDIAVYPPEALDCGNSQDTVECHSSDNIHQAQKLRSECIKAVAEQQQQAYMSKVWMYVGGGVLAFLGILFIIIFWIYRRRKSRTRPVNNNIGSSSSNGKAISDTSDATLLPSRGSLNNYWR